MPSRAGRLIPTVRNPVVRFVAIGVLMVVLLGYATSVLAVRAAEREALSEARTLHSVLNVALAKPGITEGLVQGDVGDLDRLDRLIQTRFLKNESLNVIAQGINIWTKDGRLVYSDRLEFLGQTYELGPTELRVLAEGGTEEDLLDESRQAASGPLGRGADARVRIFTQVTTSSGTPLLFEGFYSVANLEERRREIYTPFQWISLAGMVALLVLVTPTIFVLTRDVRRAGRERERLLQVGLDASDAERRRIARDLHDGVVQDLAGVGFQMAALARDRALAGEAARSAESANVAVRGALKSLRALLSEIHPPEIHADGLHGALTDLTAPAAAQGVNVGVEVSRTESVTDEHASLVLRVAQEAVRNCLRHARATTLNVCVHDDGLRLVLEVVDDGRGFDPQAPRDPDHYGLKAMSSLARDRGGDLVVTSAPGQGSTVRLTVGLQGGRGRG